MFFYNILKAEGSRIHTSAKQLRKLYPMVTTAILIAIYVVLQMFSLPLSNDNEIRFGFIPLALTGMLYGPVMGSAAGMIGDILGYLVHPTGAGFFPGFTLSAMISGFIYGMVFYNRGRKASSIIVQSVLAVVLNMVIVDVVINTFWLHIMYGNPYFVTMLRRIFKIAVMVCVQIPVMLALDSMRNAVRKTT